MLSTKDCSLVVVDVQGRLAQLMHEKDRLFRNIRILIEAAKILDIAILWCQQCPQALGPTVPEIAGILAEVEPVNKSSFSCCGDENFNNRLKALARKQVLLCGIETHVCIYQTALDLLRSGYGVHVIADAVSSRTAENKNIAIARLQAEAVKISSTEMALFELLKTADHPHFKQVARLVK